MTDKQPTALRLADAMEGSDAEYPDDLEVAAELRRLHTSEREGWRYADELEQERKRLTKVIAEDDKVNHALHLREMEALQKVSDLTALNAQLLEALEDFVMEFGECGLTEKARAAIAAARGIGGEA